MTNITHNWLLFSRDTGGSGGINRTSTRACFISGAIHSVFFGVVTTVQWSRPECQPSDNYFSSSWPLRLLRTWWQLCAWNPKLGDPNLPETMNTGAVDILMTTMQRSPRRPAAHAAASNCCHGAYGTYYRRQFWTRPLPLDLGSGNRTNHSKVGILS